jgi:dihydroxyacetone kinase-like predicted kinase
MSGAGIDSNAAVAELALVRRLALAALEALERERQRIDGLNVYPVPDGDTGMNLVLTVRALVEELDATRPTEQANLRRDFARALLMRARGTSGVILSQIVRGAVEAAPVSGPLGGRALAVMLERSRDAAYSAVAKPVEGTILTVIRELADEARALRRKALPLDRRLHAIVVRGEEALERTREQNPALAEAGVVDAGAVGLLVCLRAIAQVISGAPAVVPAPALRLVSSPPER